MEGLRARKVRQTRREIADAAVTLFLRKGFDATSVEEIARAAEVAPRTFYRYFPTKEDVIFRDQAAEDEALGRELGARLPDESDFDVLVRALRAVYEVSRSNLGSLARVNELVQQTPALQLRAIHLAQRWEDQIVEGLTKTAGARQRGQRAVLRRRVLAASTIAALRVATDAWIEGGCKGTAVAQVTAALEMIRDGFVET